MEGSVTVREVMTREFVGVSRSDPLDGAVELLLAEGAEAAAVLEGSAPVGVLTATAALERVAAAGGLDGDVAGAMIGSPPTVGPDAALAAAAGSMADADTDCLPVVEEGVAVGLLTRRDVVGATASLAERSATSATEPAAAGTVPADEAATPVEAGERATSDGPPAAEVATQSVCEICGSLDPDLRDHEGQSICADCREV